MNAQTSAGRTARKRRVVAAAIALAIGISAFVAFELRPHALPAAAVNLVSISFVGYSTNAAGQRCVAYQLHNHAAEKLLALAELPNSAPDSGLFVTLGKDRSQTIELPAPAGKSSYQLQVSCFSEDCGLLTHVYDFVQRLRRKPVHQITKLLGTVSGPVVEP